MSLSKTGRISGQTQLIVLCAVLLGSAAQAAQKTYTYGSVIAPRTWDDAANWSPPGAPADGDDIIIGELPYSSPGIIVVNVPVNAHSISAKNVTLNGSTVITVAANFTATGASLTGSGTLVLPGPSGIVQNVGNPGLQCDGWTINNSGTMTVTANSSLYFSGQSSRVNNSGIVDLADTAYVQYVNAANTVFNNTGTLRKSAGTGRATVAQMPFLNSGTIQAQAGTLEFNQCKVTNSAAISTSGGATNWFNNGTVLQLNAGSTVAGAGLALFSESTLVITANTDATSLQFDSAGTRGITISNSASLNVSQLLRWTGGFIKSASGTPGSVHIGLPAQLELTGAGTKTVDSASFVNDGVAAWTGGDLALNNAGELINTINGVFDVQTDADIAAGGALGVFYNEGLFKKTSGATNNFTTVNTDFNNSDSGTLDVQAGNVALSGGISSGKFKVASGSELQFFTRTHRLEGSVSGGPGANFTGRGFSVVAGSATVTVDNFVTADNFWLAHPTSKIDGTGDLLVNSNFNWTGGTILGSGTTVSNSGSVIVGRVGSISGNNPKTLQRRTFQNGGDTAWSNLGDIVVADGAVFHNLRVNSYRPGSAVLDAQSDAAMHGSGTPGTFLNEGTFFKSSGAGGASATVIGPGVALDGPPYVPGEAGNVIVVEGVVRLQGGGAGFTQFEVQLNAILDFSSGVFTLEAIGGMFRGDGFTRLTGGSLTLHALSQQFPPTARYFEVAGGQFDVVSDLASVFFINKQLKWSGGKIGSTFGLNTNRSIMSFGELTISGANSKTLQSITMVNGGHGTWDGAGTVTLDGAVFQNGSADELDGSTAVFEITGPYSLNSLNGGYVYNFGKMTENASGSAAVLADFFNNGTVEALGGAATFSHYIQNRGRTVLEGGRLEFTSTVLLNGGTLAGSSTTGPIVGYVDNEGGEWSPGMSPGLLKLTGNYTQAAAGAMQIELAGYTPGTNFDQFHISGAANLNGSLNVSLLNGFTPLAGDRFEILKFASRTGTFPVKNGVKLGGSLWLVPIYSATNVVLLATNLTSIQTVITFIPPASSAQGPQLTWPTLIGQAYQIEYSADLMNWFVLSNLTATAAATTISDPTPVNGVSKRFYRIR